MYSKFIPKNIQEKLKAKERALAWKESGANQSALPEGALKPADIQSRTTFVRMCSNKIDSVTNILISGGKHNPNANTSSPSGKTMRHGLDVEGDYGSDVNTFLYQQTKRNGIRPIAGIKDISVEYKGSYKAIREATVNWTVGSLDELDELTPYFLTLGKTVVVDFGWINPTKKSFSQMFGEGVDPFITFQNQNIDLENPDNDVYANFKVNQEIFTNAQVRIQKAGGDYDAIGGKVSNFEISLREDGGFDCTTQITALGSTLFSKPIDKPTDQITAIGIGSSKDLQEDKKKPVTPAGSNDNIINALINLKTIIIRNVFGVDYKATYGNEPKIPVLNKKTFPGGISIGRSTYTPLLEEDYAIALDSKLNPQVCWMNVEGHQYYFIKWGWMEDQLMNRYLAYEAGEGKSAGVKISFRSIRTKVDKNGQPIQNDQYKKNLENQNEENKSTASAKKPKKTKKDNIGREIYIVQPNDNLGLIAGLYNTTIEELQEFNNIQNADQISVGQEIVIPEPPDSTGSDLQQLLDSYNYQSYGNDSDTLSSRNYINYAYDSKIHVPTVEENVESNTITIEESNNPEKEGMSLNMSYFNDNPIPPKYIIPPEHAFEFEKESTKIRNKPSQYFMPIDIFKFWSTELMPDVDKIRGGDFSRTGKYKENDTTNWYKAWKNDDSLKREQFTIDSEQGILRNMWVNIEEIQKAFNITNADSDKPTANPPGTFETAIKNLLSSLNSNFYNVWDFELAVDPYDSTNMGVMDRKVVSVDTQSLKYTRYKTDVVDAEGKAVEDKEGNDNHKVQDTGIYKFPSFKVGSIVKSQNLTFKIPDSMALTILYGSNKEVKGADNQNNFNNPELMKMFNSDSSIEYDDKFLKGMMTANINKENVSGSKAQNIGSFRTSPQSKLVKGEGLYINPEKTPGYKIWSGNDGGTVEAEVQGTSFARTKYVFSSDGNVTQLVEKTETFDDGVQQKELVTDATRGQFEVASTSPKLYKYGKEGTASKRSLNLITDITRLIRSRVNGTIETEDEKELSSQLDPIIPAELTLEVDGIGGLVPGDIIHTDYIQEKYRVEIKDTDKTYGPYTYFMIKGVNQKVTSDTWTTELTTIMKLNRIPLTNSGSNLSLDREPEDQYIPAPIPRPSIPVPTDDEDIADDVTLDDLDFDDFEEWEAPPKPEPVKKKVLYHLGIGHSTPNLDFETGTVNVSQLLYDAGVERGVTDYEVVEYEAPKIGGMPVRPSIPVPTKDEDILPDEKLEELDYEDFEPLTSPPVSEKQEQQEQKEAKTMKTPKKRGEQKSTYRGSYWQNDKYLYSNEYYGRPDWRPIFEFKDGFRASFDRFPFDHPSRPSEAAVKTIRKDKLYSTRKAHWDSEIEGPNATGKSVLDHDGGDSRAGAILGARYR